MKIDILQPPPADIFRNQRKYTLFFIGFLVLAGCGLLLGAYAIVFATSYYETLETAALTLFVGAALPLTFFGEKLQAYKRLTPRQQEELAELAQKHAEIGTYCAQVGKDGRQPIRAEYEACREWAEDAGLPGK